MTPTTNLQAEREALIQLLLDEASLWEGNKAWTQISPLLREAADALSAATVEVPEGQQTTSIQEDRDALRRALEVIAVGDSEDPVRDAADELVALGYWSAEAVAAMRSAAPTPQPAAEPVALNEWLDKTDWVQQTAQPHELGMHRADVLRNRIVALEVERNTLRVRIGALEVEQAVTEAMRRDAERLDWLDSQGYAYGFQDMHEGNRWMVDGPFANVRAAIDAALAAAKEREQ